MTNGKWTAGVVAALVCLSCSRAEQIEEAPDSKQVANWTAAIAASPSNGSLMDGVEAFDGPAVLTLQDGTKDGGAVMAGPLADGGTVLVLFDGVKGHVTVEGGWAFFRGRWPVTRTRRIAAAPRAGVMDPGDVVDVVVVDAPEGMNDVVALLTEIAPERIPAGAYDPNVLTTPMVEMRGYNTFVEINVDGVLSAPQPLSAMNKTDPRLVAIEEARVYAAQLLP